MLNTLFLLTGLVGAIGLGGISLNENVNNDNQIRLVNHKCVQYDDENQQIILNANELNNYIWENLYNFSQRGSHFNSYCNFEYNEVDYLSNYSANGYHTRYYPSGSPDGATSFIGLNSGYSFYRATTIDGENLGFQYDLILNSFTSYYEEIKQAIELDIQANQPSPGVPSVMVQFVDILVNGIVSLGSGVANGIVAMATALFLQVDNGAVTGLSVFGGIVAIFAGLALAVGITTKVYQWVTSLGN